MTIESTRTNEPNVGKIVRSAYRLAGLISEYQNLSTTKWSEGRDALSDIIDQLEAEGVFARSVGFQDVTMVVGQSDYELAQSVLDVQGTSVYVTPTDNIDAPQSPTYLRSVRREEYMRLSNKDATSDRPVLVFVDRQTSPLVAKVWQPPGEAGTIRFPVHRLRADTLNATSTVDLEAYWVQYLKYQLAYELATANSIGIEHRMTLKGDAMSYLEKSKGRANEKPARRFMVMHRTPYGRTGR